MANDPKLNAWIARVAALRELEPTGELASGAWHGYTLDRTGLVFESPMRGDFYLIRWARPTVALSGDDTDDLLVLARAVERLIRSRFD